MSNDVQRITCPNCSGKGWTKIFKGKREILAWAECCICDHRGFLVIDKVRTSELLEMQEPK